MEKFWATRRKILGKPKEEYDILDDDNNQCPNGESLDEITIYELDSAIKQLQRRKAVGPDDIPNEALICLKVIVGSL